MKKMLFLLAILPLTGFAQSKADYEKTMQRYAKLYNKGKVKKIANMFKDGSKGFYTQKLYDDLQQKYGRILCYEYLGPSETSPDKIVVFKTSYEKDTHAIGFTLTQELKLNAVGINTSSKEINKMMKAAE